jgi:hypothetical protein
MQEGGRPKALKAIGNLNTSVTSLQFNHDAQLLAIGSDAKKDQMRMVSVSLPVSVLSPFFFLLCFPIFRSASSLDRQEANDDIRTDPPPVDDGLR